MEAILVCDWITSPHRNEARHDQRAVWHMIAWIDIMWKAGGLSWMSERASLFFASRLSSDSTPDTQVWQIQIPLVGLPHFFEARAIFWSAWNKSSSLQWFYEHMAMQWLTAGYWSFISSFFVLLVGNKKVIRPQEDRISFVRDTASCDLQV